MWGELLEGSDGALYGTTGRGGSFGGGTVFRIKKDGSGFSTLHNFSDPLSPRSPDGHLPESGLIRGADGALYGTAASGGGNAGGTVFKLNENGSGFTVIWHFGSPKGEGASPIGIIQGTDGALYGTTESSIGFTREEKIFRLDLGSAPQPPVISTQPQSQSVNAGAMATFTAVASGTAPLTYQWRLNGANLPGLTSSSITLNNVQPLNAGQYTVVVSNVAGSITSAPATLTVVLAPPSITLQPQHQTAGFGDAVIFGVTATGSEPLRYQWQLNGVAIPNANSSTFTVSSAAPAQAGTYTVEVSNSAGSKVSSPATLSLLGLQMYAGLTIVGKAGANYRIDFLNDVKSANNWVTLSNIALPSSTHLFFDLDSPNWPRRFYRAVLTP
ncbi:MAG: immunoglobulin domain-containing protein [Verrucomicrobia bacterium]|nr:immunoglobulin domain-containing protein [Verrucomicrobiota bacterium]